MRHTVFLVCEVNQEVILVPYEFSEIYKNTFFTEHLRVTASVKIEMQLKIMTSKEKNLLTTSYKPYLKHRCNNSWEFKISQQMSSEYLLSTSRI